MKPRDLFGVVIRSIGVLVLVGGVFYLYSAVVATLEPGKPYASSPLSYIGASVISLLVSVYFLRGAPHLVRFAYGRESEDSDDGHDAA